MMRKTLTKPFLCAFSALLLVFTFGSIYAGDYSKDKAIVQPAPVCDPRWYISIGGGIDLDYQATDFVSGSSFEPEGNPIDHQDYATRSYDDVFGDTLYRIQGEIGYVLNDRIELFALFKYAGGYAKQYVDRDVEDDFAYAIFVYPSDYRSWGGELGVRWFFLPKTTEPWHVRPYVSISGGATYVESISVDAEYGYDTSALYLPAFHGNLYDSSIVGTGALMLGLEVPINCHWSFGVEGGVRYESKLDGTDVIRRTFTWYDNNPAVIGTHNVVGNPENYNSAGDRLYFPANIYLKFRF
jgi:hypothetical protein